MIMAEKGNLEVIELNLETDPHCKACGGTGNRKRLFRQDILCDCVTRKLPSVLKHYSIETIQDIKDLICDTYTELEKI